MIRKIGSKYRLVSKTAAHKNLGTYTSKTAAMHREKQVEYFKHVRKSGSAR